MSSSQQAVRTADGVWIHYDVMGKGKPSLVMVHGWSCDRGYWELQRRVFSRRYQVVTIDMAGHGHSGTHRSEWSVSAFGKDIVTVIERLGLDEVILIGHSMGGRWIVEAARRLPASVVGLISLDTWADIGNTQSPDQVKTKLAPFFSNFAEATRAFVSSMFVPTSDPELVKKVMAAMSKVSSDIALSVAESGWSSDIRIQQGLDELKMPKIAINSAWRPTDRCAARRYGIEIELMPRVGHFMMLEDPATFNCLLEKSIEKCVSRKFDNSLK